MAPVSNSVATPRICVHWLWNMILIMVAVLLICLLPSVRAEAQTVSRLRTDDPQRIEQVRQRIAADQGYRIVFLGDSAFYCSATQDDNLTLSSWFANLLSAKLGRDDITVYDLTLPDCSMSNSAEILKYILAAKPDMVVFDVNISWLGTTSRSHQVLANLNAAEKNPLLKPSQVPDEFPGTDVPWYRKDFGSLTQTRGKLAYFSMNAANTQWMALKEIISLLDGHDTAGIMVYPPMNRALYDLYNLVDDKVLAEKKASINGLAKHSNILFMDYTWRFHSNHFSDNIHMLPAANRLLADLLVTDIAGKEIIEPAAAARSEQL